MSRSVRHPSEADARKAQGVARRFAAAVGVLGRSARGAASVSLDVALSCVPRRLRSRSGTAAPS